MNAIKSITTALDTFAEWVGKSVSWLALILTIITAYDVVVRYVFKSGSVALQEAEWHIFALLFLLAAAYTYKHNAHVRVDIFYGKLGPRGKAIINLLGTIFFLLPFCVLIIWASIGFVELAWSVGEGSGDPGGLPARWFLKAAIPIGFTLLLLQGVSEALKSIVEIFTATSLHEAEEPDHV